MTGSSVPVGSVLLDEAKEPLHSILVIIVLLAFDDDFLATIDELIATILREVLLHQKPATSLVLVLSSFPMLLRDAIRETTL
jgi:hypothetical protein